MRNFFKKWLKMELSYLLWGYIPALIIVAFAIFAVHFFSETIAMRMIGLFIVAVLIVNFFIIKNKKD